MTSLIHTLSTSTRPGLSLPSLQRRVPALFADHRFENTGPEYVFISTRDLVETLMQAGFVPTDAQQRQSRGARLGFSKHMLRFRHVTESVPIVDCMPEIILINSHDCSSSFQLRGGLYRFVCCNGLIVSLAEFGVIRIPHRGDVLADVVEGAARITAQFEGIGTTIERMARTELTPTERLALAEKALQLRYRNQAHLPFGAERLLTVHRPEDTGEDLWRTFNVIQENVINGGISGRSAQGRATVSRKVGAIPENVRLNLELWQQAMALIKA